MGFTFSANSAKTHPLIKQHLYLFFFKHNRTYAENEIIHYLQLTLIIYGGGSACLK